MIFRATQVQFSPGVHLKKMDLEKYIAAPRLGLNHEKGPRSAGKC